MLRRPIRKLLGLAGYRIARTNSAPIADAAIDVARLAGIDVCDATRLIEESNRVGYLAAIQALMRLHSIDLVLDVGAHEGQFGLMIRGLGYAGDLVSFEPHPEIRSALEKAAEADSRWTLSDCAIGTASGSAVLTSYKSAGFSSTKTVNADARKRFGDLVDAEAEYRVRMLSLAEALAELNIDPQGRRTMLKVDTQGADLDVLKGAGDLLSEFKIIQVEGALQPLYDGAGLVGDFLDFLSKKGFGLAHVSGISHQTVDLSIIETDCVFCKRSGARPGSGSQSAEQDWRTDR